MIRRARAWAFGSLGFLGYLFACGATTSAPDAAPPPAASVTAACSDLYDAFSALAVCDPFAAHLGKSARFQTMCEGRLGAIGVSATVLEVAETCAAVMKAAAPTCGVVDTSACAVPVGTRAAGAPCGSAMQCASGYCAGPENNTNDTSLSLSQLAPTLESCGTCAARLAAGSACAGIYQCNAGCPVLPPACAIGTVCGSASSSSGGGSSSSGGTAVTNGQGGTCVPEPASSPSPAGPLPAAGGLLGDACQTQDGGSSDCAFPYLCDAKTSRCVSPVPSAPGAPCGQASGFLCQAGICSFEGSTGNCPPVIADGLPCDSPSEPAGTCDDYAQCIEPSSVDGCCIGPSTGGSSSGSSSGGSSSGSAGGGAAGSDASVAPFDAGAGPTCVLFDPRSCR